jgi:hypothetical protein
MAPYILLPLLGDALMAAPRWGKSVMYAEPGAYGGVQIFRKRWVQNFRN